MSNLENIRVYNKHGNMLNFRVDGNTMYIPINLNKVSVNLIENERLYILEKVNNVGNIVFSKPKLLSTSTLELSDTEFKLFNIDYNTNFINTDINTNSILSSFIDDSSETYTNGYRDEIAVSSQPMVVDIMFKSAEEGNYVAEMFLENNGFKIVFELYCESEGSDERLKNLLDRFGEKISQNEELIFRESDISDDFQSHMLLNEKRKELLNSVSEIPHLTSIRGLEFIISYFGYSDIVEIKEYYFSELTGKFVTFKHDDFESNRLNHTKLSYFSLTYKLNDINGEFDEIGLPKTEDSFTIPIEEIIIKFVALKNYIESRSIGGVSKIIDVIGERYNFSGFLMKNWTNKSETFFVDKNMCPVFDLTIISEYIDDLRKYETLVCDLDQDFDLSNTQIGVVNNCYVGYFANTYIDDTVFFDEPSISIGGIIKVKNTSFDLTWVQADLPWINYNLPVDMTWENVGNLFYTTTKFIIRKNTGQTFYKEFVLTGSMMNDELEVVLPFDGEYDIILELYGYNNLVSRTVCKNAVKISLKDIEVMSFHRLHDKNLQVWETCYLPWVSLHNDWNTPVYDNDKFTLGAGEIQFSSYSMLNFAQFNDLAGYKDMTWVEFGNVSWFDVEYLSWSDQKYETKISSVAIIDDFVGGDKLSIQDVNMIIPVTINTSNYVGFLSFLESQTDEYQFTHRIDNVGNDFIEVVSIDDSIYGNFFIGTGGTTKIGSTFNIENWGDYSKIPNLSWKDMVTPWDTSQSLYRTNGIDEEFNMNNIRFYNNEFESPVFIPIFFTVDNCKMSGKTTAKYTLFDELGDVFDMYEGLYFCKRFFKSGTYSLECEITDTNGNKNKIYKNKIIKILDHDEFRNRL